MEQELKLGLSTASDLPRLLAALPPTRDVLRQENHYLVDPQGKTRDAKVMVRLRTERGSALARAVLTLKRKITARGGVFLAWEEESELPLEDAHDVATGARDAMELACPEVQWLATELGVTTLSVEGALRNTRHVIELHGYRLEIDETHFPDGSVDAEVEVETDDPEGARSLVLKVAREAGVSLFEQGRGKYSRYKSRRIGP